MLGLGIIVSSERLIYTKPVSPYIQDYLEHPVAILTLIATFLLRR